MKGFRLLLLAATCLEALFAQRVGAPTDDLTNVAVDELFNIQVTSVGRKAQKLSKAPAAVFVLTGEDIRRSGATSIPEALQWVPGLTVLRPDGRAWVVSARGSSRLYSDKILVMIDGRSLYTPLFSGVIWDAVDVPLQDIEQIEVVRGPGAVMWGPNAVNGVINIITKRAQATNGAAVSLAAGNELRGALETRVGAGSGDKFAYRFWGKLDYRAPAYDSPGYYNFDTFTYRDPAIRDLDAADGRLGFRFDGQPTEKDQWMIQGDLYKTSRQDPQAFPAMNPDVDRVQGRTNYDGSYLQGRWTRTNSAGNESVLQFSYTENAYNLPYIATHENNFTTDYQKRWQTGERNEVYWSIGYQQYWDDSASSRFVSFSPSSSTFRSGDVVIRDEFQIVPGRLMASAGIRLDYNSYGHLEQQPSARLLYTPSASQSFWAAVSRAVRVANRFDQALVYDNGYIPPFALLPSVGLPIHTIVYGSQSMQSENDGSVEAGYRFQSGQRWSIDASLFWSQYNGIRATQTNRIPVIATVGGQLDIQMPLTYDNAGTGVSRGAEFWASVRVREHWRLLPSYAYNKDSRWLPPDTTGLSYYWDRLPSDMRHQATLRSQHDLGRKWQLDLMARARSMDHTYALPSTILLDARLSWHPWRSAELSFSVSDLTDRHVLETYSEGATPAIPVRRTFLLRWSQRL
jgi:iron complex outermembrane receptor protein